MYCSTFARCLRLRVELHFSWKKLLYLNESFLFFDDVNTCVIFMHNLCFLTDILYILSIFYNYLVVCIYYFEGTSALKLNCYVRERFNFCKLNIKFRILCNFLPFKLSDFNRGAINFRERRSLGTLDNNSIRV